MKDKNRTSWQVFEGQQLLSINSPERAIPQKEFKRKVTGITELRYRRAWSFPPLVELKLDTLIEPPSLNVCCGTSSLCDLKVDLFMDADLKADMLRLPFRDESFQTVFTDPPWHLAYHLRPKFLWEMRRVVRKNGKLILNCPWVPKIPKMILEKVMIGVPKAAWKNCIPVAIYRKADGDIRNWYPA